MSRNIMLEIAYDGNMYYGFQKQKDLKTVQGVLEKVILDITGNSVKIIGSGRTDTGVSAYSQIVNFIDESDFDISKYQKAINAKLKNEAIVIRKVKEVSKDFNSRFDAKKKTYMYIINNNNYRSAFLDNHEYYFPYSLDVGSMNDAICNIIGEHNFKAFEATGSERYNTVRKVFDASVREETISNIFPDSKRIIIQVTANGFLYNMMRIIAGTILEVGLGKKSASDILEIIESEDRKLAGRTLPPEGLILKNVEY